MRTYQPITVTADQTATDIVVRLESVPAYRVSGVVVALPGLLGRIAVTVDQADQLPPTLRGVRVRGMKPREVVVFQGWCVWGFGARAGADVAAPDGLAAASAAALARAAAACRSSFSRQQCLYLRPEPQWQG